MVGDMVDRDMGRDEEEDANGEDTGDDAGNDSSDIRHDGGRHHHYCLLWEDRVVAMSYPQYGVDKEEVVEVSKTGMVS